MSKFPERLAQEAVKAVGVSVVMTTLSAASEYALQRFRPGTDSDENETEENQTTEEN